MDSSHRILAALVTRWRTGQLPGPDALLELEVHEQFLEGWAQVVEGLAPPPGLGVAARLHETAREGLNMLWEATGVLREAILREDPEGAEAALNLAAEGQEVLSEALHLTREGLEQAE